MKTGKKRFENVAKIVITLLQSMQEFQQRFYFVQLFVIIFTKKSRIWLS